MNWLILSFALMGGLTSGDDIVQMTPITHYEVVAPNDALFADFSIQADMFGFARIWGNAETYMTPVQAPFFEPYRADFGIGVALYWGPLEIGARHECDHGFSLSSWRPYYINGETQLYIKIGGKIQL